jgi:hypothetical protein
MTNVRGTGSDWPRNKFSLPSGARGRRKHTRLPKIKDRDHFREKSTSAKRRAKSTRRELCGVAASSSRTPNIENQAQPRKIERPSRRSNMEIGRARTPRRISSNASQITPPACSSTKRCHWHEDIALPTGCTRAQRKVLGILLPSTNNIQRCHWQFVTRASQVPASKTYLLSERRRRSAKGIDETTRMQHDKGCGKKRRYFYYYYRSKKKKIGAREKRVLAPENKLQHDS